MLRQHPKRGALVDAAQKAVDELQAFVVAEGLVTLPAAERVNVAAAPPFDLGLASMHSSPPLEATPVKSYFYVTDAQADWAGEVRKTLANQGLRVDADLRNEKIGYKIREHTLQRVPYLLVVGDREKEQGAVAVRTRGGEDLGTMSVADFAQRLRNEAM